MVALLLGLISKFVPANPKQVILREVWYDGVQRSCKIFSISSIRDEQRQPLEVTPARCKTSRCSRTVGSMWGACDVQLGYVGVLVLEPTQQAVDGDERETSIYLYS